MIIHDHEDRTLRAGKPEHRTKHDNMTPEPKTEHDITAPGKQTPNTSGQHDEHAQKPNDEQNRLSWAHFGMARTRRHVFLSNKMTCLLGEHEDMCLKRFKNPTGYGGVDSRCL